MVKLVEDDGTKTLVDSDQEYCMERFEDLPALKPSFQSGQEHSADLQTMSDQVR